KHIQSTTTDSELEVQVNFQAPQNAWSLPAVSSSNQNYPGTSKAATSKSTRTEIPSAPQISDDIIDSAFHGIPSIEIVSSPDTPSEATGNLGVPNFITNNDIPPVAVVRSFDSEDIDYRVLFRSVLSKLSRIEHKLDEVSKSVATLKLSPTQ
ncbi:unnamed protein product, partial [Allacma fusca]